MKVYIITEGGRDIGFGHVMRCISLADALGEKGIAAEFIINGDESVGTLLKNREYKIFDWLKEKEKLLSTIKTDSVTIVDSYMADNALYRRISDSTRLSVYIDDNKMLDFPKGIIVNCALYAEGTNYKENKNILYLLGSRYALLRKEFWNIPMKTIKEHVENIMVTFGGDDKTNMTPRLLSYLKEEYPQLIKNVVIGAGFQNVEEIKKLKDDKTNFVFSPDAEGMKRLMLASDVAISAGGQTLNELARVGVSTIGICVAENQLKNIDGWEKAGFLKYIGRHDDNNLEGKLKDAIAHLKNREERKKRSEIGMNFIDGNGAKRVAEELLKRLKIGK